MLFLHIVLVIASVLPVAACVYLFLLTLLSARENPAPAAPGCSLRFDIVIPAHNEGAVIARTLASMSTIAWPSSHYRVIVVADNCTDDTADIARASGALVWERNDPAHRGKGYALAHAFEQCRREAVADAVIVVDADSDVTPNLLQAFAARIARGAAVIQAAHGIRNARSSWRSALTAIAYGAFHFLRSRARERLQVSCGLRGNGMCFALPFLQQFPYRAYSLAEDVEYGIELGLQGVRVWYVDEGGVAAEAADNPAAAGRQRQRWEGGRRALLKQYGLALGRAAVREHSAICLDLLLDLLIPPLSQLVVWLAVLSACATVASAWLPGFLPWLGIYAACFTSIALYVFRGWQLSGTGLFGLRALLRAPVFVIWKLYARLVNRKTSQWIRTDRN